MKRSSAIAASLGLILIATSAGFGPTPLVFEQDGVRVSSSPIAQPGVCAVSVDAGALITRELQSETIRVTFDAGCRPTITRETQRRVAVSGGSHVASRLNSSYTVRCRSLNQLWASGGSAGGNLWTEYRTWLEYGVTDGVITSVYGTGDGAYTSPWTLYRFTQNFVWITSLSVPTSTIRTDKEGTFYNGPSWDHDKEIDAYGYGTGNCYSNFWHDGYIWDGVVEFHLEYY